MADLLSTCRLMSYQPAAATGLIAEWPDAEDVARQGRTGRGQLGLEDAVAVAVVRSHLLRLEAPPTDALAELSLALSPPADDLARYRSELRLRLAATYLGSTPRQERLVEAAADLLAGHADGHQLPALLVDDPRVTESDLASGWAAVCGRPLLVALRRVHDRLEPAPQGRPPRRVRPVRTAQQVVAAQLYRARMTTRPELAELCGVRTNTIHAWLRLAQA